jgi:3-hydroxyacyl-CoA dehydrogenase
MSDPVKYQVDGNIAWVSIDNPPVDATSVAVRQGLVDALRRFEAVPELRALILICEGKTFVAGADVKEFGKPTLTPSLPEVMVALDAMTKPVIAAVHGTALGGGLEVALACHYRIADPATRFGFPEVKLGLIPGAGGTQRTPPAGWSANGDKAHHRRR